MAYVGSIMPIERPQQFKNKSRSAYNSPLGSPVVSPYGSPSGSRRGSVSSITSARTEPGLDLLERLRQESISTTKPNSSKQSKGSTEANGSSRRSLKSLFGKPKKPREKKNYDTIVLTSRHAAAVKSKMMMDQMSKPKIKTAGITGSTGSAHSTAAAQEARHPHSGPPTISRRNSKTADLPMLTRIASGDEQDEEDQISRSLELLSQWDKVQQHRVCDVVEHESDDDLSTPTDIATDEDEYESHKPVINSINKILADTEHIRPVPVTRNSYGGRFHKDETGVWRR